MVVGTLRHKKTTINKNVKSIHYLSSLLNLLFIGPANGDGNSSTINECNRCPTMIPVKGRIMKMGPTSVESYPGEQEIFEVHINDYYISKYEISISEYRYCIEMGACNPPRTRGVSDVGDSIYPVQGISWQDANSYASFLSKITGNNYRLLSEVEWQYSASGGTETRYWRGNEASSKYMNYASNNRQDTGPSPLGSFPENIFGVHDMNGNVAEWVADCASTTGVPFDLEHSNIPRDGTPLTAREGKCTMNVIRGGSYQNAAYYATNRFRFLFLGGETNVPGDVVGLRVAMDLRSDLKN